MAQHTVIRANTVEKIFYDKQQKRHIQALKGISLNVTEGGVTALVGPDGAGKTTLLRMIAGLMTPSSGTLTVLNTDIAVNPQSVQNQISYMPQRFGLYDDLSVQENLDLYADLHGVPLDIRRKRFSRLLEMTNLGPFTARPAGKLSGGMKQKLGLACTLVRSPQLLLLDEPTVGVDPLSRLELWKIVDQLVVDEQLTVIASTSYLDEAERCHQVYLFDEGEILAQGTPEELKRLANERCFLLTPDTNQPPRILQSQLLDQKDLVVDAVPQSGKVRCVIHENITPEKLRETVSFTDFHTLDGRLEDAFMILLKQKNGNSDSSNDTTPALHPTPASNNHNAPIIRVKNLVRTFGDFTAVASTSFEVHQGEIFGLLGPNGAGKTTTFRMLCGLLPSSGGELSVAGTNLRTARAEARNRIGYVAQKFSLYGNLTVRENLHFFAGAYGLWGNKRKAAIKRVSHQFDLEKHLNDKSLLLPGGYKQRLAMAASLLHEPDILFLDEPTSGADPIARRSFWRQITSLANQGTSIVITTHFMEEAEYCDRIMIQDAGKRLALGKPQEIKAQVAGQNDAMTMEEAFIEIVNVNRSKQKDAPHYAS